MTTVTKKRKPLHEHGDYIYLSWEDYDPEFHAVRGHVDAEAFNLARCKCMGEVEDLQPVEHIYGRWELAGSDGWGNPSRTLMPYLHPGPGRFAMTVWWASEASRRACLVQTPQAEQGGASDAG